MTRTRWIVAAGALAGLMTAAGAYAQDTSGSTASGSQGSATQESQGSTTQGTQGAANQGSQGAANQGSQGAANQPGAMAGQLMTASATVEKVDLGKRELTLKSDEGKPFTIDVPENVTRLDNVKPGDKIRVSFYESVAVSLKKPGEAQPGRESTSGMQRAPGNLPGGAMAQRITTTAKITNVAPSKDELTIEGPQGKSTTIKVDDPQIQSQLGRLKVGDKIQATYTQAMAASVTPKRTM